MSNVRIGAKDVGVGQQAFVVAEMAWSHDGLVEKARDIIAGAARAGADAINFHLTSLPDYMVPFYGAGPGRLSGGNDTLDVYRYLEKINLTFEVWPDLVAFARQSGLAVSIMCNDEPSVAFAIANVAPDMLMIHPSCVGDERLLRSMAAYGRPFVIYTGGLHLGEIENAVRWATLEGNNNLVLQHGFQSYPTAIADNHLRAIRTLKSQFGFPVAFADHTDGDDPMAMIVPLLAVAMGADVVEKHITHDRTLKGEDFEAAFSPDQFAVFVDRLRQSERSFGQSSWQPLSERQLKYRSVVRKRAVAAAPIAAGTKLTRDIITFKRADIGLYPEEISNLDGNIVVARDLETNAPIVWEVLR